MKVKINIVSDYAQILRDRLTDRLGYLKSAVNNIKDDDSVILSYFRVLRRLVSSVPRAIFKAKGFTCPPEYVDALAQIESKIRMGENITPYLSRQVLEVSYNDALLNEWGIQHLHLGTSVSRNPKHRRLLIESTKKLLFVYFDEQCAYFIKILGHGSDFADQILIQTIHDNWPEIIEPYRQPNIISLHPGDLASTDRYRLRKAGIEMGAVAVSDGTVYMMIGGALMTSGDNMLDVMRTNDFHRWAYHLEKDVKKEIPEIVSALKEHGIEVVEPIALRLCVDDSERHWFLVDDNNRFEIPITGPWK